MNLRVQSLPRGVRPACDRSTPQASIRLLLLDPRAATLNKQNQHDHKKNASCNPYYRRSIHLSISSPGFVYCHWFA